MINQGETTEKESEQCEPHDESEGIRNAEHVHTVLLHLSLLELEVIIEEVRAHKADGAHQPHRHVGEAHQQIAKENVSLIVFLILIISYNGQGHSV